MTISQYNNLTNILNNIDSDKMPQLASLTSELIAASKKEQSALEAFKTASFNSRRISEVLSKLRVKINELNSK